MWEIASEVDIPVLRKDFVIDDYMILQAAAYGAAAVLLICALLDDTQLREYREMAEELGMDALVEAHDAQEVERALKSGARIIGVNNRDLKTFRGGYGKQYPASQTGTGECDLCIQRAASAPQRISRDCTTIKIEAVLIGENSDEKQGQKSSTGRIEWSTVWQKNKKQQRYRR